MVNPKTDVAPKAESAYYPPPEGVQFHCKDCTIMAEKVLTRASAEPSTLPKPTPQSADQGPARRPGRWLRRLLVLLILLGGAAWFAPQIVARTELRQRVASLLFPTYPGTITLGESSLDWLSPVVIRDLKGTDEQGQPLFEVRELSSSETLWTLATRANDLGTFKLVDPVLHLTLRDDGSNVEEVLTKFLSGPASTPVDVRVEVENAKLDCEHKPSQRRSVIEPLSLLVVSKRGAVDQLKLVAGNVPKESDTAGHAEWLAVSIAPPKAGSPSEPAASDGQQITVRSANWSLEPLTPLLRRLQSRAELAGVLDVRGTVDLSNAATPGNWTWDGDASVRQLRLAGFEGMRDDHLKMNEIELHGAVSSRQGQLAARGLRLSTDFGGLEANGSISLDNWSGGGADLAQRMLGEEDINISATVELQPLAATMPQTLRLREGTEITGGTVHVSLHGPKGDAQNLWHAGVKLAGLEAINEGRKISWEAPLEARLSAHRDGARLLVDQVTCESEFLKVAGSGTWEKAQFTAVGDLDTLQQNLERIFDLGSQQFAGHARVQGTIHSDDDGQITLASKVLLDDFALVMSPETVWREKHLELTLGATAQTDEAHSPTRWNTGDVRLTSADDAFELTLREPVDLRAKEPRYSATAKLSGGLVTWQNRLRPFLDVRDWRVAGQVDVSAAVASSPQRIEIAELVVAIEQLQARGPDWLVHDPRAKLTTSGAWDVASRMWTSPQTTLISESVSAEIDNMVCVLGGAGLSKLLGDVKYRANIEQVSRWRNSAGPPATWFVSGQLSGTSRISEQAGVMAGDIQAQVEQLTLFTQTASPGKADRWEPAWTEPQLQLNGRGSYDTRADKLLLDATSLTVDGLSVTAKGQLEECLTRQRVDVSGELNYDWEALRKRFGESLGKNLQIAGKDQRPFSLRGSLASLSSVEVSAGPSSSDLNGQAGIGWTAANVYGLNAGPAKIDLQLENGRGTITPLDFAVNEGRLHLAPQLRLDAAPAAVILHKDKVLDRIRLSPELCAQWMKFVAPLLADATQADGQFSLEIADGMIPVTAPTAGDVSGTLSIVQVQVRPGSLAIQISEAINQVRSIIQRSTAKEFSSEKVLLMMPEQAIPFRFAEGQVIHHNATFVIQDVTVRTSGSVGLDDRLNLVAEIPIPDAWLGNAKPLAGLKGKSIQIPITGTLSRPQLDRRVFQTLARQIGASAIEGFLPGGGGDTLKNSVLDKLFAPKTPKPPKKK